MVETLSQWLTAFPLLGHALELAALLASAVLLYTVVYRVLVTAARRAAARSTTVWDDALVEHGVFGRLSWAPPALLVYYGAARKAWVDIKLRDLLKASGYGRSKPFAARAVYIAPPDDRRKERFKSHIVETIIRQGDGAFQPPAELASFIARARAAD